jgi:hypothetical protein
LWQRHSRGDRRRYNLGSLNSSSRDHIGTLNIGPGHSVLYFHSETSLIGLNLNHFASAPGAGLKWYATADNGMTNGFRVYRCTNLTDASWQLVVSNLDRSATGTNAWTDTAAPAKTFYRVAIPNP